MSADISLLAVGGGPAGITAALADQKVCRALGIGRFPQAWSYRGADDWERT